MILCLLNGFYKFPVLFNNIKKYVCTSLCIHRNCVMILTKLLIHVLAACQALFYQLEKRCLAFMPSCQRVLSSESSVEFCSKMEFTSLQSRMLTSHLHHTSLYYLKFSAAVCFQYFNIKILKVLHFRCTIIVE